MSAYDVAPFKPHRHKRAGKRAHGNRGVGLADMGRAEALAALAVELQKVTEEHARRARAEKVEVDPLR